MQLWSLGVLPAYGAASLAAVALGALICAWAGLPAAYWARDIVAWGVGAAAAPALARWAGPIAFRIALLLAPAALAASLFGPEQSGVHRWLDVGPAQLNAAFVFLPASAVALSVLAPGRLWPWSAALAALLLLGLQPDASQATAWGLVMAFIAWRGSGSRVLRGAVSGAIIALVAIAWLRPDPLAPVPEVEGVIALAWSQSPLLALAAVAALGAAVASLVPPRAVPPPAQAAAWALAVYLGAVILAPLAGAFPVPLVGMGMSPIVGLWLAVGLLAASARISPR